MAGGALEANCVESVGEGGIETASPGASVASSVSAWSFSYFGPPWRSGVGGVFSIHLRLCLAMAGGASRACSTRDAPVEHWRLPHRTALDPSNRGRPSCIHNIGERDVIDQPEPSARKTVDIGHQ